MRQTNLSSTSINSLALFSIPAQQHVHVLTFNRISSILFTWYKTLLCIHLPTVSIWPWYTCVRIRSCMLASVSLTSSQPPQKIKPCRGFPIASLGAVNKIHATVLNGIEAEMTTLTLFFVFIFSDCYIVHPKPIIIIVTDGRRLMIYGQYKT